MRAPEQPRGWPRAMAPPSALTRSGSSFSLRTTARAWAADLEADPERLNPRGGAIALGHPLGASGVRLMATLVNHLEQTGGRYGLQTMCEAGGQANATIVERL